MKLHPYQFGEQIVFDIQQVIPLPEANDYMVKKRQKEAVQKAVIRRGVRDLTKYRVTVDGVEVRQLVKRRAILAIVMALHRAGVSPALMRQTINQRRQRFYEVDGLMETEDAFVDAAMEASSQNDGKAFDPGKYFTEDDELLPFDGKTYAFSIHWGKMAEQKMTELIEAHAEGRVTFAREEE